MSGLDHKLLYLNQGPSRVLCVSIHQFENCYFIFFFFTILFLSQTWSPTKRSASKPDVQLEVQRQHVSIIGSAPSLARVACFQKKALHGDLTNKIQHPEVLHVVVDRTCTTQFLMKMSGSEMQSSCLRFWTRGCCCEFNGDKLILVHKNQF